MVSKRLGIQGYVYIGQDGGFDREALWGGEPGRSLIFNIKQQMVLQGREGPTGTFCIR